MTEPRKTELRPDLYWISADLELTDQLSTHLAASQRSEGADAPTSFFHCTTADDLPRAFAACRSSRDATAFVFVDLDLEEDVAGALATLTDAAAKAFPNTRIALLTNRLPEHARKTHQNPRSHWETEDLAAQLTRIVTAPAWQTSVRFQLKARSATTPRSQRPDPKSQ